MARSHAQIYVTIWIDDDFRALTGPAQHAYFVLCSQGDLSHAGVLTLNPRRLASLTRAATTDSVQAALDELEQARFIVVDRDAEELLVRTYVRHDKVLHKPNVAKAMARSWRSILSPKLRQAVLDELPPLLVDGFPDNILDATPGEAAALLRAALGKPQTDHDPNPSGKGSAKGSRKGSAKGSAKGSRNLDGRVQGRVPVTLPATSGGGGGGGGGGELTSYSSSSGEEEEGETDKLTRLWDLLAHRRLDLVTADGHQPTHPDRWLTKVRTDMADRHGAQAHELIAQQPDATPEWLADRLDPQTATTASTIPTWEQTKAVLDAEPISDEDRAQTRRNLAEARQRAAEAIARRKESA